MNLPDQCQKLQTWIETQSYYGWDPHDALNSPLLKKLSGSNRRLGQVWVMLLKRSPLNLRPLLGIARGYNPKGMGLFLASYLRLYRTSGKQGDLDKAKFCFRWLQKNAVDTPHGKGWGYNFDWPNRDFYAPMGTPTIINTAFNGLAILDSYRWMGMEEESLSLAQAAGDMVLHDLNPTCPAVDELCFSYTYLDRRYVHNANVVGAWLLAELHALVGRVEYADSANKAVCYTLRRQRSDGSWWYGEAEKERWVDNFHTGFVLVALKNTLALMGNTTHDAAIEKGYNFWKNHFFLADGTPRYYADCTYPIDIHCVAQAILTFLAFRDLDGEAMGLAEKSAAYGIRNFQHQDGYFFYQKTLWFTNRIPYIRWSQAWMLRALAELLMVQRGMKNHSTTN